MNKTFRVFLTAFNKKSEPKIREVQVPEKDLTGVPEKDLELIFHYGQNMFQPSTECYSVSVGDIIEYNSDLYLVNDFGFIKKGETSEIKGILHIDLEYGTVNQMVKEHFGYLIESE